MNNDYILKADVDESDLHKAIEDDTTHIRLYGNIYDYNPIREYVIDKNAIDFYEIID